MRQFVKYSIIIIVSLVLASCGGGGMFTPDKPETSDELILGQEGQTLWESKLQYVKIVNRKVPSLPNEHPVAVTSEEMRTVLGEIYVNERIGFADVQNPLFSVGELQILSTTIASGLGQATPDEDIDFVTIGLHPNALTKESKTNSGKVFMSGGRLNIIFGLIHQPYSDKNPYTGQLIDRRLHPLLPGNRKASSKPIEQPALDSGLSYYLDPETGTERTDWLIIDIATVLATAAKRKSDDQGTISPELLEDIARNKQETGNLRHDVSNIKEILFELSDELEKINQKIDELNSKP